MLIKHFGIAFLLIFVLVSIHLFTSYDTPHETRNSITAEKNRNIERLLTALSEDGSNIKISIHENQEQNIPKSHIDFTPSSTSSSFLLSNTNISLNGRRHNEWTNNVLHESKEGEEINYPSSYIQEHKHKHDNVLLRYFNTTLIIPATLCSYCLNETLLNSIVHQTVYPREILILISGVESEDAQNVYNDLKNKWQVALSGPCPYQPDHKLKIHLRFIKKKELITQNIARNQLVSEATSAYITAFDSDDIMHPKKFEIIQAFFEGDKSIDAMLYSYQRISRKDFVYRNDNSFDHYFPETALEEEYDFSLPPMKIQDPLHSVLHPFLNKAKMMNEILEEKSHILPVSEKKAPPFISIRHELRSHEGFYIFDYLKFAQGWSSMKKEIWLKHPQCKNWNDKKCRMREDTKQIKGLQYDESINIVFIPFRLGLYLSHQ